MKWKLSLPEPKMLVYYFVKLTGLIPISVKNDRFCPPTILGKLHSLTLAASLFFGTPIATFFMLSDLYSHNFSSLVIFGEIVYHLTSLPTTFLIQIIFLFTYKKILYIANKLSAISNRLKSLDIEEDQGKFFNKVFVTTVTTNALVIATSVAISLMESNWPTSLSITFNIENWFRLNIVSMFVQTLTFVRQRFTLAYKKIYDVFGEAGHRRSAAHSQISLGLRNQPEEIQVDVQYLTDLERLRKIEALHLELRDLVDRTTHVFAIPILLKSLHATAQLIKAFFLLYWLIYNLGQRGTVTKTISFMMILCPVLQIVMLTAELFCIAHISATTCEEGNAMKVALSKAWYKFKPRKLEDEVSIFSLQLMHTPVTVSALGVFDLGYYHLHKILCTVVAYVVVMIQFDNSST